MSFIVALIFFQLSDIPRLHVRLKHIMFMRQFDELVADIKPDIVSVTAACQDINKSDRWRIVFTRFICFTGYDYFALVVNCKFINKDRFFQV